MSDTGATATASILDTIREVIPDDSPLLAESLAGTAAAGPGFADLFELSLTGDAGGGDDYLLALEYIFEGYLLHYGRSRVFSGGTDEFNLLAGDYMYARGLNHITAVGSLPCIRMLADLISFCSFIHCEGLDPGLAADAWAATTMRIAGVASGSDDEGTASTLEAVIEAASGDGARVGEMLDAALEEQLGARPEAQAAAIRKELCNIYPGFNRQRRQDGT